jgi:hypothetical protein|nr:MAG TPA: hypothetical protein [Caudoviricetes sp.]
MYVYIITEKYYDEDFRIITNIICACKDIETAKKELEKAKENTIKNYGNFKVTESKEDEIELENEWQETIILKINKYELL